MVFENFAKYETYSVQCVATIRFILGIFLSTDNYVGSEKLDTLSEFGTYTLRSVVMMF